MALVGFAACGDHVSTSLVESLPECETYLAAYRACMTHVGVVAVTSFDERVERMRRDFASQAHHSEADRERVATICRSSAQQLQKSCR